jgi:hypothetical protein
MNTPRNFALQLGALLTLYASIASLTALLFAVITITFPDAADTYYHREGASEVVRFSIATLIVVFPVYLWLTRTVNQIRRKESGTYLSLTRWLIYLSLVVGGGVLIGDFIALINGFLSGDLTTRFALKAAVLGSIVLAAFYYYLKDAQGYWQNHEKKSIWFGYGATAVVTASLILGFMHSETPDEVREAQIDDNQVSDLQSMQWRIEDYYRLNQELPASLTVAFEGFEAPVAPEDRSSYQYNLTSSTTYQLCAEFGGDSKQSEFSRPVTVMDKNYSWTHKAGEWCFERVIPQADQKVPLTDSI